jgi:hypothetical protein
MTKELSRCGNYYTEIDVDQWTPNELINYPNDYPVNYPIESSGPKERDEELLRQFEEMLGEVNEKDKDPWQIWWDERERDINKTKPKVPVCECGAGHTKFPNHHATYCPLDKKKK